MKTKQLLITICLITASVISKAQTTGTFTDPRDGQVYKTISIEDPLKGTSVTWMAQNLNYQVSGAVPYDNDQSYRKNLGLLYSFEQAKQACPAGWHIPTKTEFEMLNAFPVESLKSTKGWIKWGNGTNASGFNALPAGKKFSSNMFIDMGAFASFWTCSYEKDEYMYRFLIQDKTTLCSVGLDEQHSVRCIKNN